MKHTDLLLKKLRDEAESYWMAINKIADQQFEYIVKPWLLKNGYTFSAGMGNWAVYVPHTGQSMSRSQIPLKVLEVLEISIPLYDYELGSIMPDFPED